MISRRTLLLIPVLHNFESFLAIRPSAMQSHDRCKPRNTHGSGASAMYAPSHILET